MQLNFPRKGSGLPIIRKDEFDGLAKQILQTYMPDVLAEAKALDVSLLAREYFFLDIQEERLYPHGLLGLIAFHKVSLPAESERIIEVEEGTILLNIELKNTKTRWRFTVAHELAHWILHRAFFKGEVKNYNFRYGGYSYVSCRTDKSELGKKNPKEARTDEEWAEWQADNMAAALLMPKDTFTAAARQVMVKHGFTELYLEVGKNVTQGKEVVKELADLFQVSMRAVRIRMRTFDMYRSDE